MGWAKGSNWLFMTVGAVFTLTGLKIALFARRTTHRFERGNRLVTIDSGGLWGTHRRELRLDHIAEVVLDEIRRKGPRYQIFYVTTQGERIAWTDDHTQSLDDKVECIQAAREFLGLPNTPPAAGNELKPG
jgi:hypothetical protein